MWTPYLVALLLVHIVGYLICVLAPELAPLLTFSFSSALGGLQIWQFVTYTIAHLGPGSLIGALFMLFFFGGQLEKEWGPVWYTLFYVSMAATTVSVRAMSGGAAPPGVIGLAYAHLAAYSILFAHRRLWILFGAVSVRTLVVCLIVLTVLLNIRTPAELLWLVGFPLGILFVKLKHLRRKGMGANLPPVSDRFSSLDLED